MNINIYDSYHHYYYKLLANTNKTNNTKIINKTKMPTFTNSTHHCTGSSKHEVRRGGKDTKTAKQGTKLSIFAGIFVSIGNTKEYTCRILN